MHDEKSKPPTENALQRIDKPLYRGLRAAVAAIPGVGGSMSVIIESEISKRQSERVELLMERIDELEKSFGREHLSNDEVEDELLLRAVLHVRNSTEFSRTRILANCLFIKRSEDADGVLRSHLLELAGTLTVLELAILRSIQENRGGQEIQSSDLAHALHRIDLADGATAEVREYARGHLKQMLLVDTEGDHEFLTGVGELLASAVY